MKSKATKYAIAIIGMLLLAAGLCFLKKNGVPRGVLRALPYVCIGIGCGLFGHGMGAVFAERAVRSNPEIQKELEIEKNDERNLAIANRAKGKAYDIMTFVYGALMVSFALMGVDLIAVLLLVFAYLFVQGTALYYRIKLDKEM